MARILFVDDEALTLKLLSQAAEIIGHTPMTSNNVDSAYTMVVNQRPDLIILDLNVAGYQGTLLAEQLRQNPEVAGIPVVILSADPSLDSQERALKAGADRYLTKPVRLNTLLEVIRDYTGQ
jgi:DNA-binding response OmpR family regulator